MSQSRLRKKLESVRLPISAPRDLILVLSGTLAVLTTSALMVRDPEIGILAACAIPVAVLILKSSVFRMVAVVVGGLFALQSGDSVGPLKVAYAAVLVACSCIAAIELSSRKRPDLSSFKALIPVGAIYLLALLMSTFVSLYTSDISQVARNGIPYLLLLAAPLVGLDAGSRLSQSASFGFIGVLGTISAVAFAVDWLNRRGVSALPIDKIMASTFLLPALVFALALVMAIGPYRQLRSRIAWVVPTLIVPISLLLTGARSNLIVFVSLLGVLGSATRGKVNAIRLAIGGLILLAIAVPVFAVIAAVVIDDPNFLAYRIQAAVAAIQYGAAGDASLQLRNSAQNYALGLVEASPWYGFGLGFEPTGVLAFDTPLSTVVRLGILGTATLVLYLGTVVYCVTRYARKYGSSPITTAAGGWLLVVLAYTTFGSPVEDRGFAFGLLLSLMAIVGIRSSSIANEGSFATVGYAGPEEKRSNSLR